MSLLRSDDANLLVKKFEPAVEGICPELFNIWTRYLMRLLALSLILSKSTYVVFELYDLFL